MNWVYYDRHEIAEPRAGEHYKTVTPPNGPNFAAINEDFYDSDFDDDGPYGPFE